MEILKIIMYVYGGFGGVYALYLLFTGHSKLWDIPLNIIAGPPFVIYIFVKTFRNERLPF